MHVTHCNHGVLTGEKGSVCELQVIQCVKNNSPVIAGFKMERHQLATGDNPQETKRQELISFLKQRTECSSADTVLLWTSSQDTMCICCKTSPSGSLQQQQEGNMPFNHTYPQLFQTQQRPPQRLNPEPSSHIQNQIWEVHGASSTPLLALSNTHQLPDLYGCPIIWVIVHGSEART